MNEFWDFYVPSQWSHFNNLNNISLFECIKSKLQKSESSKVDSRKQGEEYGSNQTISETRSNKHITIYFLAALKFIYF